MKPTANNEWSSGELVNAAENVPAVLTDCSKWVSDIPEEQWSTGELVNAAQCVPTIAIDCSEWDAEPASWLEVVVSFNNTTSPAKVFDQTLRLIDALHEQYRRQGISLEYDVQRSRTEGECVVVALGMSASMSEESRERAVAITRAELAKVVGAKLERTDWMAAA